jgi:hypothetical protein
MLMTPLENQVLLLILAEREDLSVPVNARWLSWCQEQAALAVLEEALRQS